MTGCIIIFFIGLKTEQSPYIRIDWFARSEKKLHVTRKMPFNMVPTVALSEWTISSKHMSYITYKFFGRAFRIHSFL